MLELPESYTISKQVSAFLKGKIISKIELLHTPHRFAFLKGNVEEYPELLEGKTIMGGTYHGGMAEIDTEDSLIAFSDGAFPKYYDNPAKFPKNHQVAIYFDDDTAIFVGIQMYGIINVSRLGECTDGYYVSSSKKLNAMSAEFTYDYFRSLYPTEGKKLSAKAFLATEQRIPGLGNGVLQDILWEAGIDSRFDMKNATEEDFRRMYDAIVSINKAMCEGGGRDTESDLMGNKGGYITQLSKNSLNQPCMKCGHEIHKAAYMGGTVYFCEQCQKRI